MEEEEQIQHKEGNPGGGGSLHKSQSRDGRPDGAESSRRNPSQDVEMAELMSGSDLSEVKDIPRREPSDDSISSTSGSSGSDDSEKEESCFENNFKCLINLLVELRIKFQAFKKCIKPVTDWLGKVLKWLIKFGAIIMTFVGIFLLTFDQYTDVKTGNTICGMPCTCVWNNNPENKTTIFYMKNQGICEGAGDSKEGNEGKVDRKCFDKFGNDNEKADQIEGGLCYDTSGNKKPLINQNRVCYDAFGNEDLIGRYCNPMENVTLCDNLESWSPNGFRHPRYCATTIGTIIGSSVITSTFLLHRVRQLYMSMLTYLGWDETLHSTLFKAFYVTVHVLWICQLLPHAWIVMTFFICLKAFKEERKIIKFERKKHWQEAEGKDEWEDRPLWDESNRRSKIIFAIFEDTPQLTLHSMFIVNSAVKEERVLVFSGLDFLGGWYYVGAVTSAFSMAIAVTKYKELPNAKDKAIQFFSSVLAVASRAFICASYASTISEDFAFQTWTLLLPPATSFGLFIIDTLVTSLFQGDTKFKKWKINKNTDSIKNWVKLPTWSNFRRMMDKIFETVTSAVVSLIFEGNSRESLIPAYTYLAYGVVLNTMWVSESSERTKDVLSVIQYLLLASALLNLLIVQLEGKHKVRCLLYSLVFLLFLGLFYYWIGTGFQPLKKLYFTDKAVENYEVKEVEYLKNQTLHSLTPMLIIAVITSSLNLLLKIASLLRDCFIRCLIPSRRRAPDNRRRRDPAPEMQSDIEMESLDSQ